MGIRWRLALTVGCMLGLVAVLFPPWVSVATYGPTGEAGWSSERAWRLGYALLVQPPDVPQGPGPKPEPTDSAIQDLWARDAHDKAVREHDAMWAVGGPGRDARPQDAAVHVRWGRVVVNAELLALELAGIGFGSVLLGIIVGGLRGAKAAATRLSEAARNLGGSG